MIDLCYVKNNPYEFKICENQHLNLGSEKTCENEDCNSSTLSSRNVKKWAKKEQEFWAADGFMSQEQVMLIPQF